MSSITALLQQCRHLSPLQSFSAGCPRHTTSPLSLGKLVDQETSPFTGGLRTPPAEDDMNAAYHNPVVAGNTYDAHVALARHPNPILPSSRISSSAVTYDATGNSFSRSQSHFQPPLQLLTCYPLRSQPSAGTSRATTQPPSPTPSGTLGSHPGEDQTMVMHSLKLPKCISPNGGNLDAFAALVSSEMHETVWKEFHANIIADDLLLLV
jgi:hypothetical protein